MPKEKKRLLSGIKPTGELHIGNYLGAMQQFLDYQDEYESYIFIADYHALSTAHDPSRLQDALYKVVAGYLAIGIDPLKVTMFKQSDIPAHTELGWIFNAITPMSHLQRAHAFKDAEAKNKEITVGTFGYPLLMAADILLYDPDVVPVGKDQKQHIEIARDTAERFNHLYGKTFSLPEPLIREEVATVPGTDGQKMSKSYKNTIPLFATDEELEKTVMSITTDSKDVDAPKDIETDIVFAFHKHFSKDILPDLEQRYRAGGIGYKESKELLLENLKAFTAPLRKKYDTFLADKESLKEILSHGAEKATRRAEKKISTVREKIGIAL